MDVRTFTLEPNGWDGPSVVVSEKGGVLGRSAGASDIVVDLPSISRVHAQIHLEQDGWKVSDLGSSHGTVANWMRLDEGERILLCDGDRLELGGVQFVVQLSGPPFSRPKPPPRETSVSHGTVSAEEYRTRGSLLLRLQADGAERELSWHEFYETYAPIISGFARRAGCAASDVDDIVHDVMAGFFKASERFNYDPEFGRFRGYLKTATVNALRNRFRKNRGRGTFDQNLLEQQPAQVDALWSQEWLGQLIIRAIESVRMHTSIEPASWEAFELYGRRNVPIVEVSDRLEMSPQAIRKAKSRISQLIRDEIERIRLEEA